MAMAGCSFLLFSLCLLSFLSRFVLRLCLSFVFPPLSLLEDLVCLCFSSILPSFLSSFLSCPCSSFLVFSFLPFICLSVLVCAYFHPRSHLGHPSFSDTIQSTVHSDDASFLFVKTANRNQLTQLPAFIYIRLTNINFAHLPRKHPGAISTRLHFTF